MTTQAIPQRQTRRRSRPATGAVAAPRPRLRPLMVVVVAVLVAFFGMIYSRISLDRTAFELQELEHQITQQQEQMEGLRVEAARLQDPEVITARAAGLGLVYPESRTPLLVDDVETQRVVERVVRADLRAMRSAQP